MWAPPGLTGCHRLSKPIHLVQKSGTRGTGLPNSHSRFALIAACRADARAKIVITALIVTLIRFGSVMVGCAGQMIQIVAGASSGCAARPGSGLRR
jgi:hypothetical protein